VFSIRFAICQTLLLLSSCHLLLAQFPMPNARDLDDPTPAHVRTVVSNYCRLEYEGARLDPQELPKFKQFVWWSSAPKYSQIDVIARYIVDQAPVAAKDKYTVSVQYRLLGVYDMVNGYVPEPPGSMQHVEFAVSSQNGEWRVADADNSLPHPSRAAMLKWLTSQLSTAQDETVKQRLQRALTLLQAQPASPFAK